MHPDPIDDDATYLTAAVAPLARAKAPAPLADPADVACELAGYDLHEGICQHLAGTAVLAQVLAASLDKSANPEAERARQLASLVADACDQTRKLAVSLHIATAAGGGLHRALKELAALASTALPCRLEYPVSVDLPAALSVHLYRIAHEAVSNALMHSEASEVLMACCADADTLTLTIEDDGRGFRATRGGCAEGGLREISRRADLIGADLSIESSANYGTRVCCTVPLELRK